MFGFKLDPLRKIKRGHLWHFHGGIHPNENYSHAAAKCSGGAC